MVYLSTSAQKVEHKLMLVSRVKGNAIMLRWIPNSPLVWKRANQYGYKIERYTVSRDGALLPMPEYKLITKVPLKPKLFDEWKAMIDTSNYAAVLSQAIYGDSFQVQVGKTVDKKSSIHVLSKERQMRYGFGLFSADHNYEAAKYAALGYTDEDVKPNEKYLYRLKTFVPDSVMVIDSTGTYIGISDYEPLPGNTTLKAQFGDKKVMLSWDYDKYRQIYNSYIIERSDDSINFTAVNKLPFVDLNKGSTQSTHSYYFDSLPQNGKVYYYRIRGYDVFGQTGPSSKVLKGRGYSSLKEAPFFTSQDITGDSTIELTWVYDPTLENAIRSLEIQYSDKLDGKYVSIKKDIPSSERKFIYHSPKKLEGSYYIRLLAHPFQGNKPAISFPAFVQTADSTPPHPPAAPIATVNTKGIIKVKWKKNRDKDIDGYRLFRATHAYEEFSAVFSTISKDTFYVDTVQMTLLNDTIYYKLVAIDNRGNNSDLGLLGFVIKPDIIPPAAAVFTNFEITERGIQLQFDTSPSNDVKEYNIKRGNGTDTVSMQLMKKWKPSDSLKEFEDMQVKHDQTYTYILEVTDKAGLKSKCPQPVTVQFYTLAEMVHPAVKGFDAIYDEKTQKVNIFWTYKEKDVEEFWVYKSKGDVPISLLKIISGNIYTYSDNNIIRDQEYKYAVMAKFKNGTQSKLNKIIRKF